ncbi:MAG: hypothetical protein GX811_11770, partial [Lentisphaerae bacterium]|nr:hypothetical protein [Lentisphaerota bacterium]
DKELKAATSSKLTAERNLAVAKKDLAVKEKQVAAVKLSSERATAKVEADVKAEKDALAKVKADNDRIKAEKAAAEKEIKDAEARQKELEKQINDHEQKVAGLEKTRGSIDALVKERVELEKASVAEQKATASLEARAKAMNSQLVRLERQASRIVDVEDSAVKESVKAETAAKEAAAAKLAKDKAAREDLELVVEDAKARIAWLEKITGGVATSEKRVATLTAQLAASEKALAESEQKLAEAVKAKAESAKIQAELEKKVDQIESVQVTVVPTTTTGFMTDADRHYENGIERYNANDLDGAIAEFKKTIKLNPAAAGAYYNISLAHLRKDERKLATAYAYKAGEIYLKEGNRRQAIRMMLFIKEVEPSSKLVDNLKKKIYPN